MCDIACYWSRMTSTKKIKQFMRRFDRVIFLTGVLKNIPSVTSERARKRNVVNINLMIGKIPKQLNAGHHFFVALYLFSVMTCQVRLRKVGSRLSFWLWPGNTCECDVLVRAAMRPIPFCNNTIPPVNPRLIFLNFNGHRKFMMNKLCDAQSISQTSPLSYTLS